jgi:dihydrofolate synthase/folylpolyglutamate synthase
VGHSVLPGTPLIRQPIHPPPVGYEEAIGWLFSLRRFGIKPGLDRVGALLEVLGNPHTRFRSVHITGSSGKGSTAAFLTSILMEAGYRVGTYTSPHLHSFTERMKVDGQPIGEERVARMLSRLRGICEEIEGRPGLGHPTFFEVTTAMAFQYFAEEGVEVAVVEAGLGGKNDATNVLGSLVSIITNVTYEHVEILGPRLEDIALDKAGIIKPGTVAITAAREPALSQIRGVAAQVGSKLYELSRHFHFRRLSLTREGQSFEVEGLNDRYQLTTSLYGLHQLENCSCALVAAEALSTFYGLQVPKYAVESGVKKARWPGRLEVMPEDKCLVIMDCAKDVEAMRRLREALEELRQLYRIKRILVVLSISKPREPLHPSPEAARLSWEKMPRMVSEIAPIADVLYATQHKVMDRAFDASTLAQEASRYARRVVQVEGVREAVQRALAEAERDDMVLVTGSVFTVGEARELWYRPVSSLGRELNIG